jgi:hypothetical protein
MTRIAAILLLFAVGCDDHATKSPTGMDMAMSLVPTPPTLGVEIDRAGRALINLTLIHPFDANDTTHGAAEDAYNAEGNPANWSTAMVGGRTALAEITASLGIWDSIDGHCGDQLLAIDAGGDGGAATYSQFASLLVDDQLYVDTSYGECKVITLVGNPIPNYMAVEMRALSPGGSGGVFTGCGGRTPIDNAVDTIYAYYTQGIQATVAGAIKNGVPSDGDPMTPASLTDFPFLNPPN